MRAAAMDAPAQIRIDWSAVRAYRRLAFQRLNENLPRLQALGLSRREAIARACFQALVEVAGFLDIEPEELALHVQAAEIEERRRLWRRRWRLLRRWGPLVIAVLAAMAYGWYAVLMGAWDAMGG